LFCAIGEVLKGCLLVISGTPAVTDSAQILYIVVRHLVRMNFKIALVTMSLTLGLAVLVGGLMVPALAEAPDKPSSHRGYTGLDQADESVHGDEDQRFFSKGDVEFHTGTGQGGFCVSGVCPQR